MTGRHQLIQRLRSRPSGALPVSLEGSLSLVPVAIRLQLLGLRTLLDLVIMGDANPFPARWDLQSRHVICFFHGLCCFLMGIAL